MLRKISYFNYALAIFIILWGAWVRLSGSGAGCGKHWPLCNGVVFPLEPSVRTLIEYTHRFTSGVFGITVFWGWVLSIKSGGSYLKKSFLWSLIFTISEALIGAVLVKKGLVEDNDSLARGVVIALHLANTMGLLYFLTQNIFFSSKHQILKMKPLLKLEIIIITFFILTGATGAIAALGNTLFPETDLLAGVAKDFSSSSHILINLRTFHPFFALILGICVYLYTINFSNLNGRLLNGCLYIAIGWGVINWVLLAPSWGALIHLLIADVFFSLFTYMCLTRRIT
jgi:heme a synthase